MLMHFPWQSNPLEIAIACHRTHKYNKKLKTIFFSNAKKVYNKVYTINHGSGHF
jgi:hypothetical protein